MFDISLIRFLPKETNIPFLKLRWAAMALSVIGIIASIFLFTTKNLNYGLDFKGGTVWEFHLKENPTEANLGAIRELGPKLGLGELGIQTIGQSDKAKVQAIRLSIGKQQALEGDENDDKAQQVALAKVRDAVNNQYGWVDTLSKGDLKTGTNWLFSLKKNIKQEDIVDINTMIQEANIPDFTASMSTQGEGDDAVLAVSMDFASPTDRSSLTDEQKNALSALQDKIVAKYGEVETLSVQALGTKVSGELKKKGIEAVIAALLMVLIYIWFRFEWQFGLGAVLALTHDVILTIGVFSLTGREFNLTIVAAILTIVGYSLNDTVIVYDRVRENLRKFKKMPLAQLLNLSINDTLSRTIMTSGTTMLALFALYIWGGAGLNGFAFAMIWGVFVGTYSSIFVASPLLLMLGVNRSGKQK